MSAVEEIQQAIATLERLRAESTPGAWEGYDDGILVGINSPQVTVAFEGDLRVRDIDLIVTLHRTIDAQLAIMRLSLGDARGSEFCWQFALPLARSINGGAS